jgi:hypothetical protein
MGVRKFRSIEEMNREKWRQPGDPALYRAIASLWEFGRRTSKRRFVHGVHRYRSIESMSAAQEESARLASSDQPK